MIPSTGSVVYSAMVLTGLVATILLWRHAAPRRDGSVDPRMFAVYLGALSGAYLGAKVAFLIAEGWRFREDGLALASGHSITGALVGGVLGVELAKALVGMRQGTGDLFALSVPLAVAIGRVGCLAAGCCPGVECAQSWWSVTDALGASRWPAAAVELLFNLAFFAWAIMATQRGWLPGRRFAVYLILYGTFRFGHEFLRDDSRWWSSLGGYHLAALAILATGIWLWHRRRVPGQSLIGLPRVSCEDAGG
jgi:prolipoprotein diacylglyceryltransferase